MTDLDEARGDLNALIREAHGATKDLRQASRDLDARIRRADEIGQGLNTLLDAWEERIVELSDRVLTEQVDEKVRPIIDQFIEDLSRNMELLKEAIRTRAGAYLDSAGLPEDLLQNNFTWQSWRKE